MESSTAAVVAPVEHLVPAALPTIAAVSEEYNEPLIFKYPTSFHSLPQEVVAEIFSCLGKDSKRRARLVCSEWKEMLDKHFISFSALLTDETYSDVRNFNQPIETLRVRNFRQPIPQESVSLSRNKLAISPRRIIFQQKDSTSEDIAQSLILPSSSEENICKILMLNRNIESLTFARNSLCLVRSLPLNGLYLRNLRKLEIKLSEDILADEKNVLFQLAKIKMPVLTELRLDSMREGIISFFRPRFYEQHDNILFYVSLFQFLANCKSLKTLICFINFTSFPYAPPNATGLPLERRKLDVVKQDLSEIQLESFSFVVTRPEGVPPYNLGLNLMSSQRRLSKLEIDTLFDGEVSFGTIQKAVEQNCTTLRHFSIRSYLFMVNIDDIQGITNALHSCSFLDTLKIDGFKMETLKNSLRIPSIKNLELVGDFEPQALFELGSRAAFPALEFLKFWHLTSINRTNYIQLSYNLKLVITNLPGLRQVNWLVGRYGLGCLRGQDGVTVKTLPPVRGLRQYSNFLVTIDKSV